VHLAAAGLAGGKDDGVAEAFEDADDGFASLRKEGVVIAGDEERNSQTILLVLALLTTLVQSAREIQRQIH
jgi:hypothetical protein